MSLTFENQTFAPQNIGGEVIPAPRTSPEQPVGIDGIGQEPPEALADDEHIREAIHRSLGLSADRAVKHYHAYNTLRENRDHEPLDGGEMVIIAEIVGQDIDGTLTGSIEIDDEHRGGLDELTIKTLGMQAMGRPKVRRIVL